MNVKKEPVGSFILNMILKNIYYIVFNLLTKTKSVLKLL